MFLVHILLCCHVAKQTVHRRDTRLYVFSATLWQSYMSFPRTISGCIPSSYPSPQWLLVMDFCDQGTMAVFNSNDYLLVMRVTYGIMVIERLEDFPPMKHLLVSAVGHSAAHLVSPYLHFRIRSRQIRLHKPTKPFHLITSGPRSQK